MRKKIMAFVFAAGLLMALAVPQFGSVGTVHAHAHQCNDGGAVPGEPSCEPGDQGALGNTNAGGTGDAGAGDAGSEDPGDSTSGD